MVQGLLFTKWCCDLGALSGLQGDVLTVAGGQVVLWRLRLLHSSFFGMELMMTKREILEIVVSLCFCHFKVKRSQWKNFN